VENQRHTSVTKTGPQSRFEPNFSRMQITCNPNILSRNSEGYGQDGRGIGVQFPAAAMSLFYTASRPAVRPTQPPTQ
jgi:hypothetical protein